MTKELRVTDRKVPVGMRELAPCAPRPSLWRVFSLERHLIRMGFQRQGIRVFPEMGIRVLGEVEFPVTQNHLLITRRGPVQ